MSLFISNSKYRHTGVPVFIGIILLTGLNLMVAFLPDGYYKRQFYASVQISQRIGDEAMVILFGDSRATVFNHEFFQEKILSFASPNNTVVFSKLLFDQILHETNARPRVMIITLGANNYNKHGIFPLRDFAIRRLASFSDIIGFRAYRDGYEYMIDALFAKIFPVYGRRMEIRSPSSLRSLFGLRKRSSAVSFVAGMKTVSLSALEEPPERTAVSDHNYWLIYKRSVYCNYELSYLHTGMLESLIDTGITHGATVVIVQLPIEPKMRQLEKEMVGNIFDNYIKDLIARKSIIHLDLRDDLRFEFQDLNHLSFRGSRDLTKVIFNPLISDILARQGLQKSQAQYD